MNVLLKAPASKSVSHRLLIGAALASGHSVLRGILDSADLERTRDILGSCGAEIASRGPRNEGVWHVRGMVAGPRGGGRQTGGHPLSCDVGESGTTCRLLTAVLAAGRGLFRVHGAPRMHERPIGGLTGALLVLGADIAFEERDGYPPLLVRASGLAGGEVALGLDESSQYFSGLLLAAPLCREPLTVTVGGKKAVSWPYVGLTLQTLHDFGIDFDVEIAGDGVWRSVDWRSVRRAEPECLRVRVLPGAYRPGAYDAEGDWSGASCLLAAGAAGPRAVTVAGLRPDSLQGDRVMLDLLAAMGARVRWTSDGAVSVYPGPLRGIEADMGACPDLVPTVAALAAFASGPTRVHNVAHLRLKESDRIAAPAAELRKAGVRVEEHGDGLVIWGLAPERPRLPEGVVLSAHNDHRIAMSLALLGLGGPGIHLDHPEVVRKSFPRFWNEWKKLLE